MKNVYGKCCLGAHTAGQRLSQAPWALLAVAEVTKALLFVGTLGETDGIIQTTSRKSEKFSSCEV